MAQVFPPGANWLVKWTGLGAGVGVALVVGVAWAVYWGPTVTQKNRFRPQPIPFSHQRHVGGNGLDCRYCHTTVETSSFAGIPPTETCMTCHSQILTDQPMFAKVHESWDNGTPMEWTRVNDVPDFVYFNHSVHVNKGIGCSECHGPIHTMRLTYKAESLHMSWCLRCHKEPERFIRPKEFVFDTAYEHPPHDEQMELGRRLVEEYNVEKGQLLNCSICHR
jgi:hypothetical protein